MRRIATIRIASLVVLATMALGAFAGTATAQDRVPNPATLRLECRVVATGPAAVACEWSPSQWRDFAAYRLGRFNEESGRVIVFRADRRFDTAAVDRPVRPGRYLYWVAAYNHDGRLIGHSEPVVVIVEPAVTGG